MHAAIAPGTRMGPVGLVVADLGRSVAWYETSLGLRVHRREGARAALGTGGEDLLVLDEVPGAPPVGRATGLYHFALLVPARRDLAAWLAHAARTRVALAGMADHFVSEAIYLSDPDGHGIEVYWDRPREVWEGRVGERMTTMALDVDGLLGELADPAREPFDALAAGTVMGHVHLRVADVPAAVAFYCDTLGFGLMAQLGRQAAFLAAGGYHHHIGANSWESAGAGPAPQGSATLRRMTVVLPAGPALQATLDRVAAAGAPAEPVDGGHLLNDPSGNPVVLASAPA
ncbi:VOC family protein [Baekduia soli]|uniref:VOC family protein n=1 Tax=Baekduia soli TaxID=496014 RepID=A0A5B8UD86_9ACTN|nr:VOC family protein [Baekduia soli]